MLLGVGVGLLAGPRSPVLERTEIRAGKTERLWLRAAPDPAASEVKRGKTSRSTPLRIQGRIRGADGGVWYRVKLDGGAKPRWAFLAADEAPPPTSATGWAVLSWLGPVGDLFLRLLKLVIVPLVFASLVVGVGALGDATKLGRMGGMTVGYFVVTTVVAIALGLAGANLVRPGNAVTATERTRLTRLHGAGATEAASAKSESGEPAPRNVLDRLVRMVPDAPLHAASRKHPAMLQVIVFALLLGVGILLVGPARGGPLLAFLTSVNDVMVAIVGLVMELAPYGVLALLAEVTGRAGTSVLGALAAYTGVVLAALAIHATATYGLVLRLFSGYPLGRFYRGVRPAQLIAFSTSSSSATLPVSIRVAEENLGVSRSVAGFVLPLGATINMDGTALYQGVAAVFIAQVFGMDLSLSQQLEVLLTATLASVGAAGVPGAGIVTLALVLASIGVPTAGIALILGVDRLLDMFRTAVNVTGDLSCAVFVARRSGELESPPGEAASG